MPRVYAHRFDHDVARARRAAGETYASIARDLGVSPTAVAYACDPVQRERSAKRLAEWVRSGSCPDCGAPCTNRKGTRCQACATAARATSVRDGELYCSACDTWKPDDAFPHSRAERVRVRRGRHTMCRACLTEQKRDWRARNKVPCSHGCGRMVDGKNRPNPNKPPECHSCATKRVHRERRRSAVAA